MTRRVKIEVAAALTVVVIISIVITPFIIGIQKEKSIDDYIVDLKSEDSHLRYDAAEALGKSGDARAVPSLISALKDREEHIRSSAAMALGKIGDTSSVEPLIEMLEGIDRDPKAIAAWSLGEIKDPRSVEPLINVLKNDYEYIGVRINAAKALGKIGDKRALHPLIDALSNEDPFFRRYAALALGNMKELRELSKLPDSGLEEIFLKLTGTGDTRAIVEELLK